MGVIIAAVVTSLILGRAYDISKLGDTGVVIFEQETINANKITIPKAYTFASYKRVDTASDFSDFLDIDGELALKLKSGKIDATGMGSFVRNSKQESNTLEIMIKVRHETVTETFPSYIKHRTEWMDLDQENVGTHYIRSITYGGELYIVYRIIANSSENYEKIKAAANVHLQLGGSLDAEGKANFERLKKDVDTYARAELRLAATTGLISMPQSIKELFTLIESYPDKVKSLNEKKGSLLSVELVSLKSILPNRTEHVRSRAMNELVEDAINKYDDLKLADEKYNEFLEKYKKKFTEEQEEQVDDFYAALETAKDALEDAIDSLDTTQESLTHFDEAFESYGKGGDNIPRRYTRWLEKLKSDITGEVAPWFPYTKGTTHYIHWGSKVCTLPSPRPVFTGYAASSPKNEVGNGANVVCLPGKDSDQSGIKVEQDMDESFLASVGFMSPTGVTSQLECSLCNLENATAAFVVSGSLECPEKTKLEYTGFLAGGRSDRYLTAPICIDSHAEGTADISEDKSIVKLTPVKDHCKECDETEDEKYSAVMCAVCSR